MLRPFRRCRSRQLRQRSERRSTARASGDGHSRVPHRGGPRRDVGRPAVRALRVRADNTRSVPSADGGTLSRRVANSRKVSR